MEPRLACGHDPLAIAAVADGAALGAERAEVEERLLTCRSCLRYWEDLRWLNEALRDPRPPLPPAELPSRVMAAVAREERKRVPARFAVALLAAVVIVMGLAMTVAPADGLAESVVAEPFWTDLHYAVVEPLALTLELDRVAVAGLSVAVAASAFLLSRLIRLSEG